MYKLNEVFNLTKTPDKGHKLSVSLKHVNRSEIVDTLVKQVLAIRHSGIALPVINWYQEANTTAALMALHFGYTEMTCAGVLSALSPQNKWERNKVDARALCWWHEDKSKGIERPIPKVSTYNSNRDKALSILDVNHSTLEGVEVFFKGEKTRNFFRNIAGDVNSVTVDLWALRGSLMLPANTEVSCTSKKAYAVIKRAYQDVAELLCVEPSTLQATQWVILKGLSEGTINA